MLPEDRYRVSNVCINFLNDILKCLDLFDVFDVLPTSNWFQKPYDEFVEIEVCATSGFLAKDICPKKTI